MHFSHWNTYKKAQQQLNEEIYLCIGQNALKNDGLFSLEERMYIANYFYGIPKKYIILLPNKEIILETIKNAKKIIRGIRSEKDLKELEILVKYYDVGGSLDKLFPICVPKEMQDISSSKLIENIKTGIYKPENNWIPIELLSLIKQKLSQ